MSTPELVASQRRAAMMRDKITELRDHLKEIRGHTWNYLGDRELDAQLCLCIERIDRYARHGDDESS